MTEIQKSIVDSVETEMQDVIYFQKKLKTAKTKQEFDTAVAIFSSSLEALATYVKTRNS